jgi:hypothetical protein
MIEPTLPGSDYCVRSKYNKPHDARLFLSQKELVLHCQQYAQTYDVTPTAVAHVGGVFHGDLSYFIFDSFLPSKFYAVDYFQQHDFISHLFTSENHRTYIEAKFSQHPQIKVLAGEPLFSLSEIPEGSLNYVFVVTNGTYDNTWQFLRIVHTKMKNNGVMHFHNYSNYSTFERSQYGVQQAIHEFIEQEPGVRVLGMSLDRSGYHDIALQVTRPAIPATIGVKLTLLTPCSRPENLERMMQTIQFHLIDKWYIIYDTRHFPFQKRFSHPQIVEMECKDEGSVGHQIRNMGMNIIHEGLLYFLDDDNLIHPSFWNVIANVREGKIYTFDLLYQDGTILLGNKPVVRCIDTAQYIFDMKLVGNLRFDASLYIGDGVFIESMVEMHKDKWEYIPEVGCYYNRLKW